MSFKFSRQIKIMPPPGCKHVSDWLGKAVITRRPITRGNLTIPAGVTGSVTRTVPGGGMVVKFPSFLVATFMSGITDEDVKAVIPDA